MRQPPDMEENILNKQLWTAYKGWTSTGCWARG